MGLLPNWLWLQFPSFGCAKFVNRRHTLSQVCLLFSHLARAKSENFASKPIRQQTLYANFRDSQFGFFAIIIGNINSKIMAICFFRR